jgi:hypothetical protein
MRHVLLLAAVMALLAPSLSFADDAPLWVTYPGGDGPGKGKKIVLISGDEEYRSEEGLPMLGKLLSQRHGFECTVLFAVDPKGEINPDFGTNIPGMEAVDKADLVIILTRFRNLPDDQMKHFVDYLDAGKPIIGLRTATHAFNIDAKSAYAKYTWGNGDKAYEKGFGRQVLGETWVSHWGNHGSQSTRGIIVAKDSPIVRGIKEGEIWGPTDVYEAHPLEPFTPIVLGEIVQGMKIDDKTAETDRNKPMLPVAWTRTYKGKDGHEGRVFTTTMGAATDLATPGTRRMVINATFWALGLEDKITPDLNIETIGEYKPTGFGFGKYVKGHKPADHLLAK